MTADQPTQPIRILHLSDIHFRSGRAWDADPVLRKLVKRVRDDVQSGLVPDLVAFTGDLAFSGAADQYETATGWLQDQLWPVLGPDLPHDRLLIVPGNHDVDREKVRRGSRHTQQELLEKANQHEIASVLQHDDDRADMLARHAAWSAFVETWFGTPRPFCWSQRDLAIRGTRLHIAELNSAWMSCSDQDYGRLLLGRYQLNQAVQTAQAEDADWRLVLMHHPWSYLAEFDQDEARAIVHQHADLVLRGHLHKPASERIVPPDPTRSCLELAAGSIYEDSEYPNAFQWIELAPGARHVRVHFRAWLHNDWQIDRNQPGGPEGWVDYSLQPAHPTAGGQPHGQPAGAGLGREATATVPAVDTVARAVAEGLSTQSPAREALIVTALPVEFNAVCAFLQNRREETLPDGTVCEFGAFAAASGAWSVAVLQVGAGNEAAAIDTTAAILAIKPDIALFVGVAGGLKDVALGDVVAATKVYGYESGKDEESLRPRPEVFRSSHPLEQRARAIARRQDWATGLSMSEGAAAVPQAFVAPIAAGSKVVASSQSTTRRLLLEVYGDALAVEMEGLGFLAALHRFPQINALVVRAISDLIDGKAEADAGGSQELASQNAAAFAFAVLEGLGAPSGGGGKGFGAGRSPAGRTAETTEDQGTDQSPAGPGPIPNSDQRSGAGRSDPDREERFAKLRQAVVDKLAASHAALEAMEKAADLPDSVSIVAAADRAERVFRKVTGATFPDGTAILRHACETLQRDHDRAGVETVKAISRLLIPWLFIAGDDSFGQPIDEAWAGGRPGQRMVSLPTRMETFAEIIMAGLDRAAVAFCSPGLWPKGERAVELPEVEEGRVDADEHSFRRHLHREIEAPTAYRMDGDRSRPLTDQEREAIDRAIDATLLLLETQTNRTTYLLWRPAVDAADRRYRDGLRTRIGSNYKRLAIVELGTDMDGLDAETLAEIHHLLFDASA